MNHLELFSGIGGFRRALDLLSQDGLMPFECVGYSEIDSKAKITYKTNYFCPIADLICFISLS